MSQKPIFLVDNQSDLQRLDNFLLKKCKQAAKSQLYKLIRKGQVRLNGKRCQPSSKIHLGDSVRVPPFLFFDQPTSQFIIKNRDVEKLQQCIISETDDYLVIDKPSGIPVHAGTGHDYGVIDVLLSLQQFATLQLAHRLDVATSGCLVLAKNKPALLSFQQQLQDRTVKKTYSAILKGELTAATTVSQKLMSERINGLKTAIINDQGKDAETHFEAMANKTGYSQVNCHPATGRTHQIRAHAAYLNCPIVGDVQYGAPQESPLPRDLYLHALSIEFEGGQFRTSYPQAFSEFWQSL